MRLVRLWQSRIILLAFQHLLTTSARDLHIYRGAEDPGSTQFVMGHEFTGVVVETGDAVQNVTVGDKIVSPFTTSWCVTIKR